MSSIWKTGSSGEFNDASQWNPMVVPGPGDNAVINSGTVNAHYQSFLASHLLLDRGGIAPLVLNIYGGDPTDGVNGFASGLTVNSVGDGGPVALNIYGQLTDYHTFSNHGTLTDSLGALEVGITGRTTVTNSGEISAQGGTGNTMLHLTLQSDGSNTPIVATTLINQGVIAAKGGGFANAISLTLNGTSYFDNKGVIEADAALSTISILGAGKFQNDGTIIVHTGTLSDRTTIANNGLIEDDGGQISIVEAAVNQSASGRIKIDNGGTVFMGESSGGLVEINNGTLKLGGIAGHAFASNVKFTGSKGALDFGQPVNYYLSTTTAGSGTLQVTDNQGRLLNSLHLIGDYNIYDFASTNGLISYTAHSPTAPTIVGTVPDEPVAAGSTIRPFATVRLTDINYNYGALVGASIVVLNANGKPTDADGVLSGSGLSKTDVGSYNISDEGIYLLQYGLSGLTFTPTSVAAGKIRTTSFDLTVTDTRAGLSAEDATTSVDVVGATPTPTVPLIAGTWGKQIATPGTDLNPFLGVTVSDTNSNPTDSATLTVRGAGGSLNGPGLDDAGNGVYRVAATTPGHLTDILNHLNFTGPGLAAGSPSVTTNIQLDVADRGQVAHDSQTFIVDLAPAVVAPPPAPPSPPSPPDQPQGGPPSIDTSIPTCFSVVDTTTHTSATTPGDVYTGPVVGLLHQYINVSHENLSITATAPSAFIHTGAGDDAIDVSKVNGTNVLDGGEGSNFLVGGTGGDTFFLDDRNAGGDIWSTVVGFHAGDNATVWGVTPKDFKLSWLDNQGAAGFAGLTLGATAAGKPNATLTLTGYSTADLKGRLSVSFGHDAGSNSDYMQIHGN